ncbi:MAG: DNA protecting protein DprA [Candidatus Nealsonbacteria bacterium RIFCSPLOWO2_12_FULL_39_31]|uniref:DNA protecting protein DprA n=3 Tax=Candidatus Nealsoniibacteriota TaxID=1817911 RepID=A0A1G2ELC3_9BACT|nr:MAG: protecting protein DprA protein [Parcubacteria group bacterium GW2011_GWA2_38_27]OGZ19722.1 MAG: DNA protecting protein DprA [Candidatus Nealsonbacteria bacterium RIFCSPHIGHO2_01_FULL_38_55]OGZ20979.1 MAG: DNA protecting protein DprA [Candidatus Nealsonbacteria bacterium RIFCSPHIGHO2_02_38_10]OGZ21029.1 MAG: DNA protecting protein DprA [Candidatus Nealsonbacteria bacterium RIFCSPHIGHO2_02_FULL_38_75]OGZ22536.1 MAG: DNA protecting protein DprA [Candidatus Nealsonbacteria bacterium RIFCSP
MQEYIEKITIDDKNYPADLKKIKNPPKILYFRGEIKQNEPLFAVVGARNCSSYGKQATIDIAGNLAEAGLTIVSGLAPGIDSFAHWATIERGKRTIAVFGTGVDKQSIYPSENMRLAEKILETGGLLISEYPPGTQGTRWTFPQRNRIISGLSLGVLVIEAKQRSGALITADCAFEQDRKVFALPGSIYSLNSKGPHFLIKKGAKLIENSNDILKELNLTLAENNDTNEIGGQNAEENLILNILEEGGLHIDQIIKTTKLSAAKTAGILAILEMEEKIRNLGGNIYALRR